MYEKLISIYPSLTKEDFVPNGGTITIQNNSDGKGDFIAKWNHPTLPRPTEQQLGEIE